MSANPAAPALGSAASANRRTAAVAAVFGMIVLLSFPGAMVSVFAPALSEILGDRKALGALFSALAWGGLAGATIGGVIADRFHPVMVLRAGFAVAGASSLLAAGWPCAGVLVPALAAVSAGFAATSVAAFALLPRLVPESPRRIMSANLAVSSFAGIVLPIAAGALLQRAGGADAACGAGSAELSVSTGYAVLGAVLLGGLILTLGPVADVPRCPPRAAVPGGRAVSIRGVVIVAAILGGLHGGVDTTLYQWAPTFLTDSFAERAFPPYWILSAYAVAYFVGRSALAFVREGRWERLLLILPGLIGGALLAASFASRSYAASASLYVAASFFYGIEYPVLMGVLARRAPQALASAMGLMTAAGFVCSGVLSLAVGDLAEWTGSTRAAMLILPCGFVAFSAISAVWVWTWGRGDRGEARGR